MECALAISDVHGRLDLLAAILLRHPEAHTVFLAGDITQFGGADDMESAIGLIVRAGIAPGRIAGVCGNCDTGPARKRLEREGCSVDGRALELGFARVAGAGGGLRLSGHTPYERTDKELRQALVDALGFQSGGAAPAGRPLVVLTHNPPRGTPADLRGGAHVGSPAFAELLAERSPDLWICGHIHESPCAATSGRTLVLNPGPAQHGRYAKITFDSSPGARRRAAAVLMDLSAPTGCTDT